jgi:indolepyruvate ferredoxin oxidoreductase alpha subunit
MLHGELEQKLERIAAWPKTYPQCRNPHIASKRAVVVSGVAAAHGEEVMQDLGLLKSVAFFYVQQPYPLHRDFIAQLVSYEEVLVLEETAAVIEMQLADRKRVRGKIDGTVPLVGELLPETIEQILAGFTRVPSQAQKVPPVKGRRPTLCAGCPHRASFFAIKKAAPRGIYTSDIGCYTLGLNLGAVDTVLCMGAAISQAAGFYHAYKDAEKPPDIIATIGDSTFFHAGTAPLIDAVSQRVGFVLVILDNQTTAMTGNQPTPAIMQDTFQDTCCNVDIASLVQGCGVEFLRVGDPCQVNEFTGMIKDALGYCKTHGPAVVIARHPCLIDKTRPQEDRSQGVPVMVTDNCDGCGYCIDHFECPALVMNGQTEQVAVDPFLCSGCGVCLYVCPKGSIVEKKNTEVT